MLDRPDPDESEEIVEAEIVEPEGEPANDTPPRVAEMIKSAGMSLFLNHRDPEQVGRLGTARLDI